MKIKFERICKPYIHLHLVQSWTFCSYFKNTQFPLKVLLLTSALSIHDHKDVLFVNFRKVKLTHNPKFQSVIFIHPHLYECSFDSKFTVHSVATYYPRLSKKKTSLDIQLFFQKTTFLAVEIIFWDFFFFFFFF